jgi:hypothetical protein
MALHLPSRRFFPSEPLRVFLGVVNGSSGVKGGVKDGSDDEVVSSTLTLPRNCGTNGRS